MAIKIEKKITGFGLVTEEDKAKTAELVAPQLLGVTVALLNCINMLGGSFFHTCIGKVMDIFWTGEFTQTGLKQYSLEAYQHALSVIPVCAVLGATMILWLKKRMKTKHDLWIL